MDSQKNGDQCSKLATTWPTNRASTDAHHSCERSNLPVADNADQQPRKRQPAQSVANHSAVTRISIQHHENFKFTCKVCKKGYDDQHRFHQHVDKHPPAERALPEMVHILHATCTRRLIASQQLCRAAARADHPDCKSGCVKDTRQHNAKRANNVSLSADHQTINNTFVCTDGNNNTHWTCAGYDPIEFHLGLPIIVCPECLLKAGKPQHFCIQAHSEVTFLFHYIENTLGRSVVHVPADGYCISHSVMAVLASEQGTPESRTTAQATAQAQQLFRKALGQLSKLRDVAPDLVTNETEEYAQQQLVRL